MGPVSSARYKIARFAIHLTFVLSVFKDTILWMEVVWSAHLTTAKYAMKLASVRPVCLVILWSLVNANNVQWVIVKHAII